jgi:uncharacterized protein (TIGR02646 family)
MLKTPSIFPRKGILNHLRQQQALIDCQKTYEQRVRMSKTKWLQKKKSNAHKTAFQGIEKTLKKLAIGTSSYCNYCESNLGTSIEHVFPRGLFPHKTFDWNNFLWACKQCNGVYKHAQFQLFKSEYSSDTIDLIKDYSFVPPPNDDAVFINPRTENPLTYLQLNLSNAHYEPISKDRDSRAYKKAFYTLETLQLNRRKGLLADRMQTIAALEAMLDHPPMTREVLVQAISHMKHPTILREIERQENHILAQKAHKFKLHKQGNS